MKTMKFALALVASGSMLVASGLAFSAKPGSTTGGATATGACEKFSGLFNEACDANVKLAMPLEIAGYPDAAYVGSCSPLGGACADSVYNRLGTASDKFTGGKAIDGCKSLVAIQTDLTTWNTASKQKINNPGYTVMSAAVGEIQKESNCSAY